MGAKKGRRPGRLNQQMAMLAVGMLLLLAPFATPAAAAAAGTRRHADANATVKLVVVGAGAARDDPALGTYVTMRVDCAPSPADCPPWVRVDRADGVADTAPLVRVVDTAVSFANAPAFPLWLQPAWGPVRLGFGGAVDNRPIPFVASGWTASMNGTRLTANSSNTTVYYSPAYESATFQLSAEDLRPGAVRLSVSLLNASLPAPDKTRFDRFVQTSAPGASPPQFASSFAYHQESASGSVDLAFQQPGIYYWGATPSYRGRAGRCTAGGEYDARPSMHPLALVVAGPDGAVNATLPSGFQGAVHRVQPLATPHQFCITATNVTLFAGGRLYVPLCRPDPHQEIPQQPPFASIVVPEWMAVAGNSNETSAYESVVNETAPAGDGRVRVTFYSRRWSTYNNYVPLYFSFDASHAGEVVSLQLLIHEQLDAVHAPVEQVPWQALTATLAATPQQPPPSRMITSITWADASLLAEGEVSVGGSGGASYSFLDTYRALGFNTVPHVSVNGDLAPSARRPPFEQRDVWPGNRTGDAWRGLRFGPELSGFGGVFHTMLTTPPNASVLAAMGVPPGGIDAEMSKWRNAVAFHNATGTIDIAYDGAFFRADVQQYCDAAALTRADVIFADDEGWGEGWPAWRGNVGASRNAEARRLPNESDLDLAWRMVREMLRGWTDCLATASPGTFIAFYGTPFPAQLFADAGMSAQPSSYGPLHYAADYPRWLAAWTRRAPRGQQLLPWLTACTYGQMSAADVFTGALQSFASGATGFSFFIDSCLDDMGKLLALSSAVTLAAPHEALFFDGALLTEDELVAGNGTVAVAGMQLNGTAWLSVTPIAATTTAHFTLSMPAAARTAHYGGDGASGGGYFACALQTGGSLSLGDSPSLAVALPVARGVTQAVVISTTQHCEPPPAWLWLP